MIDVVKLTDDGFYRDEQGRPFVRVSTILKDFGFIDTRFFDDASRERGSDVHLAIKYRVKGTLDDKSLDAVVAPRVAGFDKFVADTGFKAQFFETTVADPHYRFAGTLDLFGCLNFGLPILLDVKTGPMQKAARLQTGAYAWCVAKALNIGYRTIRRYALELPAAGGYKLVPIMDMNEGEVMAGLAGAWWYRENINKGGGRG